MRVVDLPSGKKLELNTAPFADADELWQAFAAEMRDVPLQIDITEDVEFFKNMACASVASIRVREAVWKCMRRCRYGIEPIGEGSFEPVETREDYMPAYIEVAKENILPFLKGLYAVSSQLKELLVGTQG